MPNVILNLGAEIHIRVTAAESAGLYSAIELSLPAAFPGAPRHRDKHLTGGFVVLKGLLRLMKLIQARA